MILQALSGGIELSSEEMTRLRRIAAAPPDIEQLIEIAEVSRSEFLAFMTESGLWEDPEYARLAHQVLSVLVQRASRKTLQASFEAASGFRAGPRPATNPEDANKGPMASGELAKRSILSEHLQAFQVHVRGTPGKPIHPIDEGIPNRAFVVHEFLHEMEVGAPTGIDSEDGSRNYVVRSAGLAKPQVGGWKPEAPFEIDIENDSAILQLIEEARARIDQLSPLQRELVESHRRGLSYKLIAQRQGLTYGAVLQRLTSVYRTLATLRDGAATFPTDRSADANRSTENRFPA